MIFGEKEFKESESMVKVFICIPSLSNAGAERFATELACGLNQEKYNISVIVTQSLNKQSSFYRKLIDHKIRVISFAGSNKVSAIYNMRKLLKDEKPDIIHTNVGAALHMLIPQLTCGRSVVHIFTTHSMGYRIFNGIKKQIIGFCFHTKIIIPVAICDTVKKSLTNAYNIKGENIECVYNGVDIENFSPRERLTSTSNIVFVSTGTLYHIKNHKLLIEAFSIVHRNNPNTLLRIIGDGELMKELVDQVNQLGLKDFVIFEGNQDDVSHFLNMSDIYCCSSKVEGLPISVLEAMACALPVITTPAGGVVDIINDGENGFIVQSNPIDYANKMLELANNPELRCTMAIKSRELAKIYSLKKCISGYEQLYSKYSNN